MNFSIAKGEFCVLLGPSSSGKSTLLNIIGGIDDADDGYISINGDKLKDLDEKQLTQYRRKHLGYVFQMYNLISNLNVKENIVGYFIVMFFDFKRIKKIPLEQALKHVE